jgi:hypothetical protein
MNTNSITRSIVALSLAAICGCGQAYTPAPDEHIAGPRGGGDVFTTNPDSAAYQTVSYDVLRSWLVGTLHMPEVVTVGGVCDAATEQTSCPVQAPVQYLDANKGALGVPVFTVDPDGTQAPSLMTSGGFKVWIVAASSACGIAAQNPATRAELFPAGVTDVEHFYNVLLSRSPSEEERDELAALQASFADDIHKSAAVCTTVLVTLENLSAN